MTNFEYLKSLDSEYKMTDVLMYFISEHHREMVDPETHERSSLPLLRWLQSEREAE